MAEQAPLQNPHEPEEKNGIESGSLQVVLNWLSTCREHHASCRRPSLPTPPRQFARILDLGDGPDTNTLKLVSVTDPDAFPSDMEYLTLSHCWGGAKIPILTRQNYAEFLEQISFESLPWTFRDAIQLTRRLGFRYIWIDSLCIIQDSNEDWLDQAALMGEIYQGSSLNIAATRASQPKAGIFNTRNAMAIKPLRVALRSPTAENEEVFYDVGTDYYDKWTRQVTQAQLCNRGWVVQERLLAPRVVHFAKQQLFWECVEMQALEESPNTPCDSHQPAARISRLDFKSWDPFASDLTTSLTKRPLSPSYVWSSIKALRGHDAASFSLDKLSQDPQALEEAAQMCYGVDKWTPTHPLLKFWATIITTFSSAQLSHPQDRLIAISGLAQILSTRTDTHYISGHWRRQLPRQLLWQFLKPVSEVEQGQSVAPSWSWAYITGGLGLRSLTLDPILEAGGAMHLINIVATREEDTDTPNIKITRLRVRGRLLPISLDLTAWPTGKVRHDYPLVPFWIGSTPKPPVGETFLVPTIFTSNNRSLPDATPNALILEALETKGQYRRVGTAYLSSVCPLHGVVPGLYSAYEAWYEDSNDNRPSESSVEQLDPSSVPNVESNPQQELMKQKELLLTSSKWQNVLGTLQQGVQMMSIQGKNAQRAAKLNTALSTINAARNNLPANRASVSRKFDHVGAQRRVDQALSQSAELRELGVEYVTKPEDIKPGPQIAPREAVAPRFYLRYVNDDKDVVRYGHFVFEIV